MPKPLQKKEGWDATFHPEPLKRRAFLHSAGIATASAALLLSGCKSELIEKPQEVAGASSARMGGKRVDLGSGDIGVLNYAYALEQLEAAFYKRVVENPAFTYLFDKKDQVFLSEVRAHEKVHREFFKAALGDQAIPSLTFNFKGVYFNDQKSILTTAKTFEDLGVAAYNGAGRLIANRDYLTLAGKIVSVEARHAAYLRELLSNFDRSMGGPTFFAGDDVINMNGLDLALPPAQVLAAAAPFIEEEINFSNLT